MRTLQQLIEHLETAVERAEDPNWCVLTLTAADAEDLLHDLRNREKCAAVFTITNNLRTKMKKIDRRRRKFSPSERGLIIAMLVSGSSGALVFWILWDLIK